MNKRLLELGANAISFEKMIIDLLSSRIHRNINIGDTIVISGTPRGGTTWFMELIETLQGYRSIFEPFHRDWFPQVKQLGLPPRPYLEPNTQNKPLKEYLGAVFTGKIVSHDPVFSLAPTTIYKRLLAPKILVKFIRANRLLPWISNNFPVRGIYFMIRHPCATIASQIETGVRGSATKCDPAHMKLLEIAYEAKAVIRAKL